MSLCIWFLTDKVNIRKISDNYFYANAFYERGGCIGFPILDFPLLSGGVSLRTSYGIFIRKQNRESTMGIRGEKSGKDMASSRNLVSTIETQASPTMGDGTRCPEG